jgi:hypothetical protein
MPVTYTGITRTTSSPIYTDFNVSSFLAECNALKALLVPGALLDHNLLRRLQVVYNNFETHRHTAADQYFVAYTGSGNLGGTDSAGTITTTDPVGFSASTIAVLSGTLVTADLVDDFVSKINAAKTHLHNVTETSNAS